MSEEFALTPGQERFIFKLSRMAPDAFWLTCISDEIFVGMKMTIMGKKGIIKLLFFDHRTARPEDVSPVIAWDDGSVTVGSALLNFIE